MNRLWNNISYVGVNDKLPDSEVRSIVLVNRLCAIMWLFVFTSIALNVILNSRTFILPLSIGLFGFSLTYLFNVLRFFTLGKLNIFITTVALLTFMSFKGGAGSGLELYFLSLIVLPLLIFNKTRFIYLLQFICVICLILQKFYADKTYITNEEDLVIFKTFYILNSFYSCLLIVLGILFYKSINKKYERKLIESNRIQEFAKEELRKSEALLSEGQRMAHLGSWEWNIESNEIYWSNELYRIFGYEPQSVKLNFEFVMKHIYPDDLKMIQNAASSFNESTQSVAIEFRIIRKNGSIGTVYGRGRLFKSENESEKKVFGSVLDITDITNTAEQLRQKDEFLSIASHELKTPLTSIKAYNQLILRSIQKKELKESELFAEKTAIHIERLTSLVNDLLDVSKIQAGKLQFNMNAFDIDTWMTEVLETMRHNLSHHDLTLKGRVNVKVFGDKQRLEQVVANYISNAAKYSPDADKIILEVKKEDQEVIISVTDFGIGIPKEKLPMIFGKFYRVDNSGSRFSGLGIGLYISADIIKRHNGRTWVESKENEGSTFSFSLPIVN